MAAIGYEQASPVLEKRKRAKSAKKKKKDNPLSIHVLLLRPTQFNVGYTQVEKLVASTNAQIVDVKSKKELKKRLSAMNRRKKVPIVVGPGEEFYMVDHHHWVRALWESDMKFSHKKVYFYILQDLSHLTPLEFWEEMKRNKWVYLNSCGEPRNPTDLPADITGLLDDPYRALARSVRGKHRGWRKSRLPFTEFLWADYLRTFSASFAPFVTEEEKMEAKSNKRVFDLAVALCRSDAAALLPGYIGQPAAKENEESVDMSVEV